MADRPSGFLDRFARLEIPEELKQLDWSFLESPWSLPSPLPLEELPIFWLVNGRLLVPREQPATEGHRALFYAEWHALEPGEALAGLEQAWHQRHDKALRRAAKLFWDSIPASMIDEPKLLAQARSSLEGARRTAPPADDGKVLPGELTAGEGASLLASSLTGKLRLMRLHGKLYDLVTLREYVRIFEKAIGAELLAKLQAFDDTASPEDVFALIEASKDQVHAKARSPLRNKLLTARAVVNGVTLLPIYRESAAGLFDAYRRTLEGALRLRALDGRGTLG